MLFFIFSINLKYFCLSFYIYISVSHHMSQSISVYWPHWIWKVIKSNIPIIQICFIYHFKAGDLLFNLKYFAHFFIFIHRYYDLQRIIFLKMSKLVWHAWLNAIWMGMHYHVLGFHQLNIFSLSPGIIWS